LVKEFGDFFLNPTDHYFLVFLQATCTLTQTIFLIKENLKEVSRPYFIRKAPYGSAIADFLMNELVGTIESLNVEKCVVYGFPGRPPPLIKSARVIFYWPLYRCGFVRPFRVHMFPSKVGLCRSLQSPPNKLWILWGTLTSWLSCDPLLVAFLF